MLGLRRPSHPVMDCPNKIPEEKDRIRASHSPWHVRPIEEKHVETCITLRYKKRRISALVDTGSDLTQRRNRDSEEVPLESSVM